MANSSSSPLASYSERLPQVQREFRLFADRVEIDAQWTLGRRHQATVMLADLEREPVYFAVRNRWFKNSVLLGSLAVAAALVFTREGYAPLVRQWALLGWPVAGVSLATALLTFPKRIFARFRRKDGRPGLDVCNSRRDRAPFDAFVREVQRRIGRA